MRTGAVLLIVALAAVFQADPADRFSSDGDLAIAEREYRELLADDTLNATVNYNLGTVLLLGGQFDQARPYLEAASATSDSPIAGSASYNLGNTDLQPAFDDEGLADRDDRLRRAIDAYRRALTLDPADEDARWNLELARRLLERESPPPADGGGGGGSGGGDGPPRPGDERPAPAPSDGPGPQPDVAEVEAEELLSSARERELQVQRDRLRKPQTEGIRP